MVSSLQRAGEPHFLPRRVSRERQWHPGILDGARKLANAPAVMLNTFRKKSGRFRRKLLIYVFNGHLRLVW